jgi:hypothetical protein
LRSSLLATAMWSPNIPMADRPNWSAALLNLINLA